METNAADYLHRYILPAAFALLPGVMNSPEARALLIAIALQESECQHRRQLGPGPARGFWQFESIGVVGVLHSASTHFLLAHACSELEEQVNTPAIHSAIEHNDVLAAVVARLALWPLPGLLAGRQERDRGWAQYLKAWKPGAPRPADWPANFAAAWAIEDGTVE